MSKIQVTNAGDLKAAYMQTYAGFAIVPGDIVESSEGRVNMRYARELLGTLVQANLVTVETVNGEEEVWQTVPTYDTMDAQEAEAKIDAFLNTTTATESGSKPANAKKDTTMTTATPTEVHDCYCGCGEKVPAKSFYRPGHDARHAGVIGRKIAANYNVKGFDRRDLLNALPSDRLVAKAEGIAEKAIEKIEAKAAREDAKDRSRKQANNDTEDGIVKVGKKEFAATRDTKTGEVVYYDGDDIKAASKTAAKTFSVD